MKRKTKNLFDIIKRFNNNTAKTLKKDNDKSKCYIFRNKVTFNEYFKLLFPFKTYNA